VLKDKAQTSLNNRLNHSVSLYSQSILKTQYTLVPLILLSLFTVQSQTSLLSRPSQSDSLFSQLSHKSHSTFIPLTQSVCIHSQITNNLYRRPTHSVSLDSTHNLKPHIKYFLLTPSVCIGRPNANLIQQTSLSFRLSVFTIQSQTSFHKRPIHSVNLYSKSNHKSHSTVDPHTPSACIHSAITNVTPK
jgi:hypothetical protein